jgi:hypothetical protein
MGTSELTFENSFFFKRGRRIFLDRGMYNPLGETAKLYEEAYNSLILQEAIQQLLIDAIASDLSKVPPMIKFPPGVNFIISPQSRFYDLTGYLAETHKVPFMALIFYGLDLFNLIHPDIINKHLPPERIGGGSRRRTRRMRGGSMPLSYFTDAPRVGSTEPTGVGYGSSSFSDSGWIRAPINQTGGRSRHPFVGATRYRSRQPFGRYRSQASQNSVLRGARYSHNGGRYRSQASQNSVLRGATRYRSRHPPAFHAIGGSYRSQPFARYSHKGGFSPSIMGSFASNGLRLLPLAGYVGYNQFKNFSKTKRFTRRSSRSKRSSK